MLLFKTSPMSMSMGSALLQLETRKGDMTIELNPPMGSSGRFVRKYISRSYSCNPRMSFFTDHADSEGEAIASASPMRLRRTMSLSDSNFTVSNCRNSESAESTSLIRLNTSSMVSHPSLDEVNKLDISGTENPVENSITDQQIQNQSDSDRTWRSTTYSLGSSVISFKGEELSEDNVQVTTNISEPGDSFLQTLHESCPLVSGKNEEYEYSTLEVDPKGVTLFCTARGCRVAHVPESDYMNGGSGIEGRGGNFEAEEDEKSRSSTDMYYRSMLEANPGNPLLLTNYARFLHEVQHDMAKAEEYYERAILASSGDAEVLSLYAKFTWETQKDATRAESYFDRAVKAAPDDCYVLSSYAHFLWNSEEEEEGQNYDPTDLQNVTATPGVGSVSAAA